MNYLLVVGLVLAAWAILRNLGNERESELRLMEARVRREAEDRAKALADAIPEVGSEPPN